LLVEVSGMNQMAGHIPAVMSGIFAFTWTYQPVAGRETLPSVVVTPLIHG